MVMALAPNPTDITNVKQNTRRRKYFKNIAFTQKNSRITCMSTAFSHIFQRRIFLWDTTVTMGRSIRCRFAFA